MEQELQFLVDSLAQGRREAARWHAEASELEADLDIIERALLGGEIPDRGLPPLPPQRPLSRDTRPGSGTSPVRATGRG